MRILVPAALLALMAHPAAAQLGPAAPLTETAPLSLQSQLGSIPLDSPRARAQAGRLRTVRLVQPGPEGAEGVSVDIPCPESGCQQLVTLLVDGAPRPFLADIQFVTHGAYLTLQPRNIAIARVVEFRQGRPGAVFIKGQAGTVLEDRIAYIVVPSRSLQRLDAGADGRTLASGNVYTRKTSPDIVVQVRIEPPPPDTP